PPLTPPRKGEGNTPSSRRPMCSIASVNSPLDPSPPLTAKGGGAVDSTSIHRALVTAFRACSPQIKLVAIEKRRELIRDRNIIEVGEWDVRVAGQADRRQSKNLGVSAVRIDEIDELLAISERLRPE